MAIRFRRASHFTARRSVTFNVTHFGAEWINRRIKFLRDFASRESSVSHVCAATSAINASRWTNERKRIGDGEEGAKQTELPDTRGNRNRSDRALDGPRSSKRIGEIVPDNMTEQNGLRHAMRVLAGKGNPRVEFDSRPVKPRDMRPTLATFPLLVLVDREMDE